MHIKTSEQESLDLGFGGYSCNWGLHICGLYETERERDDIIFGFLRQGVMDGDLQVYSPNERTKEDFRDKFSPQCPACAAALEDPERFRLLSSSDLYYPNGEFSPWDMDRALNAFFEESQKNGRVNIRVTAEMSWALNAVPGAKTLMAYESRFNYFIEGKPWIGVCPYNLNKFDGGAIMDVLRTHPYSINRGVIMENPYYVDPDLWLAENAPEYANAH